MAATYAIVKFWDENERVTEGRNGRVYVAAAGRWQWGVDVNGEHDSVHDRKSDATDRVAELRERTARAADAAAALGRMGGAATSRAKGAASRANGAKGGRPVYVHLRTHGATVARCIVTGRRVTDAIGVHTPADRDRITCPKCRRVVADLFRSCGGN